MSGNRYAQAAYGEIYDFGWGVKRDLKTAIEWYRKAAAQGAGRAEYALGMHAMLGSGLPQDMPKALQWFRLAAEHGCADAQYQYGCFLEQGLAGLKPDHAKAFP